MSVSAYTGKKTNLVLLFDFLLLIVFFVVFLVGLVIYSLSLSRNSGRDLTTIPRDVFLKK